MRCLCLLAWLGLAFPCGAAERYCREMHQWIQALSKDSNAVEITAWSGITLDLRYATSNNMAGQNLYCSEHRAFLHKVAAYKLQRALVLLANEFPGYRLRIWDASRPVFAQEALRAKVRGTPLSPYVSSPGKGSLHNFGMALDLTVQKPDGSLMDMGSDFDELSSKASAQASIEDSLMQRGELSITQINNRQGLRRLMQKAGLTQLPSEWWHFNAASSDSVRTFMKMFGQTN